jgi:hypothetical protein
VVGRGDHRRRGLVTDRDGDGAGSFGDCSHAIANFEFERSIQRLSRRSRP